MNFAPQRFTAQGKVLLSRVVSGMTKPDLLAKICDEVGTTVEHAVSASRLKIHADKRMHVMWILRNVYGWSFQEIGNILGGRDHTTIIAGVKRHKKNMDKAEALMRNSLNE